MSYVWPENTSFKTIEGQNVNVTDFRHVLWRGHEEDCSKHRIIGHGHLHICRYWKTGIVMDLGTFGTSQIASHEIGHG